MAKNLEKVYEPKSVEGRLYALWEEKGYFHAAPNPDKKPFSIVIPPPNITGQLHMGHALDNTLQDCLIRFKRMQGFETLWMPGTDHASIATEVKIVEQMASEGVTKADIGREGFLERAWAWRKQYGGRIVEQLKQLGSSCDWERERFTMDEGCSNAVRTAFVDLYDKGLIYRGDRIINWCPDCKTALSDAEVEYEEQASHLWYIRYPAEDGGEGVVVATTRPETMLGDTGVAVHPDDPRYAHLVGKNVVLPLMNRVIPVVADTYVDLEFGTGAVKMTPAHDPNDFEVGMRHHLEVLRVLDDGGVVNEFGGAYAGLERYEARKRVVADLEAIGALVKIEDHPHNVGACYRCHTTVEPIVSKQWFVSMKPLAEPAMEAVRSGDTRFLPERFSKTYFHWMENIRDWCISRQLWWGHRIPAYYCEDCGEMIVAIESPSACAKCGSTKVRQDEDVLDTWFSSGLWPFSTMGWPDRTEELAYFYPTNVLVTGYDIIFFWVARMIVFGMAEMGEKPFDDVLIHGIVRDAIGRKMSKSLGNGIDPLEEIDKYGAESLRFSLTNGISPGNDMRYQSEKVEASRNFCNKIWNAARFVLMNLDEDDESPADIASLQLDAADKWLLTRLNAIVAEMTAHLEEFDIGLAAQKIYDFAWSEFCDWYIEMAKARLYGEDAGAKAAARGVLVHGLRTIVQLLHPFMPFITEEIYQHLPGSGESVMVSAWPVPNAAFDFPAQTRAIEKMMELTRAIRNLRAEMNVPPATRPSVTVLADVESAADFEAVASYLQRLSSAGELRVTTDRACMPASAVPCATPFAEAFLPLNELIDVEKEKKRLGKEAEKLQIEIDRADAKLNNPGFTNKAPANVIDGVRAQLEENRKTMAKISERLASL